MKSLLTILTEPNVADLSLAEAHLSAAVAFARALDAHLDVLALGVDATPLSYDQFGIAVTLIQIAAERAEAQATALAGAARTRLAAEGPELKWALDVQRAQSGGLAEQVGMRARLADLVILPQPFGANRGPEAQAVLDSALFDGRAPVLVLADSVTSPDVTVPGDMAVDAMHRAAQGGRIVIAWNRSAEAMAAVRAALPLLRRAQNVSLAVIDPGSHGAERSDPGGMLCRMLARHGVQADVAVLAKTLPRVSDVLNRHLRDTGADLLVMGAYGHSRLRETLFGGATRDLLETCPVPVLMAH